MKPATDTCAGRAKTSRGVADLHDAAVHEHRHAVGERHRLFLVVRDVDRGDAERALQLLQLEARFEAQLGVEVGQRLVEQEEARLAHDGARQRDALLLAARELARPAREQVADADLARPRRRPRASIAVALVPTIFSGKPMFSATVMCG